MPHTFLSVSQVADIFGVHPNTIVKWADAGRLPSVRTAGGHRRFRAEDVEALRREIQPEPAEAAS